MDSQLIISALRTELIGGDFICCDSELWGKRGREIYNDPFSRLYWVRKGRGKIVYEKGTIQLEPGKLIVIPAFTPARYSCEEGMELFGMHFRAELFGSIEIFKLMNWDYTVEITDKDEMSSFWKRFIKLSYSKKLKDFFSADTMLRQLLCRFVVEPENLDKMLNLQRFYQVIVFIEQNLHRKITLKDLTKVVPLQTAYFCSLFSKTIGESPMNFINRKRIEKSQFLMDNKKLALKEIASQVGFEDVYYFSRVFKKVVGIAPNYYRIRRKF